MPRSKHILLAALLTVLFAAAPARAIEKATIVLQWLPQAQFAGFYVAKDKGFYRDEGLYLHIMSGGPDVLASEYLETGRADFATMFLATGIRRRASLPVVNVGQFVQHSALMLITKKSSGIEKIEDMEGKKIGLWANEFQIQPRALFKRKNMRVTVVPQSDSLDMFMRGGVQVASGMWYNEYHTLMTYGLKPEDLKTFFFSDYALNFPEDGIYCLEKTANRRPEVCRALVRATARGWVYAFNHPEEALQSVIKRMKEARVTTNPAHQRWMLARMEDIILSDDVPKLGVLRQADYERVVKTLKEEGVIDSAPLFPEFYRGPVR
ncbi:ABC transporter substrate-binding protein [Pseudodesulfovibrio sp.]|uniref:ABC transporter substrate-binding protein n=1 Tax=unclassified Pseudodesulfovibrio TaxID=2661612 RepID=UPI003AFF8BB9